MVSTPEELKQKHSISIGFVVWVGVICFSLGTSAASIFGLSNKVDDEVGGLRADWERHNIELEKQLEAINQRIDRKVKNHELIHHQKDN